MLKRKFAVILGVSALFGAIAATPAGAIPKGFVPPPIPAYCHGYDTSWYATNFGGVHSVVTDPYGYPTVQQAQQADKEYCRTGVLQP